MTDYVTNPQLSSALREQTDELSGILQAFAAQIDERFTRVEQRLDDIDTKYGHLITTIDSFLARIDKYEAELAARDSQFERLLVWARKVSESTGIPLENL